MVDLILFSAKNNNIYFIFILFINLVHSVF